MSRARHDIRTFNQFSKLVSYLPNSVGGSRETRATVHSHEEISRDANHEEENSMSKTDFEQWPSYYYQQGTRSFFYNALRL